MNLNDQELSKLTLDVYNDPDFVMQYAATSEQNIITPLLDDFCSRIRAGAKILDIACAAGRDSAYIQNKGFDVTGIDYSRKLVGLAKQQHPEIEFIAGDFMHMPFEDDCFDAAWCMAALVHLPTQAALQESLLEFRRVIKPGGIILIWTKAKLPGQADTAYRKDKFSGKSRYFRFQEQAEFDRLLQVTGYTILQSIVRSENDFLEHGRDEKWLQIFAKKDVKLTNAAG